MRADGSGAMGSMHEITVKALAIGANYAEMDPKDMKKMATLMPNATSFVCENGSHLRMWDDQSFDFRHLLEFLHTVFHLQDTKMGPRYCTVLRGGAKPETAFGECYTITMT
jgi:hypothetical protein